MPQDAQDDAEPSEELTTPSNSDPAPDGGLRAWLVALGAASTAFACLGLTNSFGVFQSYYATQLLSSSSPDAIAWIGSLSTFLQFAFGGLAGPLFDRFGPAWIIRPAAVTYVLSIFLLSLCTQYWHFMLQTVLSGLSMAMLQFPAFAAVSQYFDRRRGAALGLVLAGSSVGGVVFPIALSRMLNGSNPVSFAWTVRIMGFVVLPLMVFACLTIRARLPPRRTEFFILGAFREARFLGLVAALFLGFLGMMTPMFFLPTYAVSKGMEPALAGYLSAILNAASTFGRVIPGVLADKYGRLNIFALGSVATGVVVMCMNSATTTAGLIGYSVAFGFASGTIISGATTAFSICTDDMRNMGTYMGMGLAVGSLAALIGPPVNGAMLEKYGGFLEVSIFSGVMCLAGGVVAFGTKAATKQGLFGRV
ncbi:major facilitator superfamily domain-containing protein [Schizothecium vesticola]|uniref:Major facilitator superfamily domain-containing protein n=1 Tax=Schizothecium vesticola TaxID=314040 RepID=A0AA40BPR8_9PEZI|nr:major facilitator superfamily domain-containing protein [Schizothecium vesticola]